MEIMWKITERILDEEAGISIVLGKSKDFDANKFATQPTIKFRLLDDDGEVYFYGLMTKIRYNDYDDPGISPFDPLDMYRYSYGCTEIHFFNEEHKKWETL